MPSGDCVDAVTVNEKEGVCTPAGYMGYTGRGLTKQSAHGVHKNQQEYGIQSSSAVETSCRIVFRRRIDGSMNPTCAKQGVENGQEARCGSERRYFLIPL